MTAQFLDGNHLTLLNSGAGFFPALIAAIDEARDSVHLETYIYADDASGRAVMSAMCRAVRRGVTVRLLVDGFGGGDFPHTLMPEMIAAGIQVMIYRPEIGRFVIRRRRLRRLHRKMSVVDGRIAFVGGINIIDDLNTPHQIPPRFDFAVRIEGPLVEPIHRAISRLWETISWVNFRRRFRMPDTPRPSRAAVGNARAAFVVRDNLRHRRDIEDSYLNAIRDAEHEIIIANAYFLPGVRFRHALIAAARRGVKVVVLLQGRVEYRLLHYAAQALYGVLLDAGVEVHEYHRSFLHAKVAVIDGDWATVGSSNIDPFSLLLAKEANIVVRDRSFATLLRSNLVEAMQTGARLLRREQWQHAALHMRIARWVCYQLTRLLLGVAGYGRVR